MDKIIFFDIDKTIFDREKYLQDFFKILEMDYDLNSSQVDEVGRFYREIKDEYGFFSSEAFLARIYANYPNLKDKLNYYFLPENLGNFLFEDSKDLKEIRNFRLGIFSKGDTVLQKAKIINIIDLFENNLIYIYHDKLEKISDIIEKHNDSDLTFVDDNITVLLNAKEINPNIRTILIDRLNESDLVNNIDFKLSSLSDIIPILNNQS